MRLEPRITLPIFMLPALVLVATAAMAQDGPQNTPASEVFAGNCATCHGATGRGDGPASYLLYPKPRDFTSGVFRFKSTFNEDPPTRADLERTIRNGIERTAMPAFSGILSDEQIASMIDYVLAFNAKGCGPGPFESITIPPAPQFTDDLIHQGQLVFEKMGCVACHGRTGRGDGPSALELRDKIGYPLPPADFTTGVFKSGRQPEDLYRTILVGVPGTPNASTLSMAMTKYNPNSTVSTRVILAVAINGCIGRWSRENLVVNSTPVGVRTFPLPGGARPVPRRQKPPLAATCQNSHNSGNNGVVRRPRSQNGKGQPLGLASAVAGIPDWRCLKALKPSSSTGLWYRT